MSTYLGQDLPRIGTRKLHYLLGAWMPFGRDQFFDLLRRHGLLVPRRARSVRTTHSRASAKNLIRTHGLGKPGEVLVADLTYLRLRNNRFCYASLVSDAVSRKILGVAVSDSLAVDGCLQALRQALATLGHRPGLIHHSDRGFQYGSAAYRDLLEHHGIRSSMTEQNHCYENAIAERINGILKHELMLKAVFPSIDQARKATQQAVKIYNTMRPHRSLDNKTPDQCHYGLPKKPVNLFRT